MSETFDKKEKLLVESAISNREILLKTYKILYPEFFQNPLSHVIGFVRNYFDQYSNIPDVDMIEAETNVVLTERILDVEDYDYILDEIEEHCKKQSLRLAILNSVDDVDSGNYTAIEDRLRDAMNITLSSDIGTNIFEDVATRLENMKLEKQYIKTGITAIDELIDGIAKKELGIFAASTGVGKSLMLANMAIALSKKGLKGMIVSLELDEDVYAIRTDSMITGVPTSYVLENIDEVQDRYEQVKEQYAPIFIKRVSMTFTLNDLKTLLNEYKLVHGEYPDYLCVDYIDIMKPVDKRSSSNKFEEDEGNTHGLRDICVEYGIYGFTASQLNREADENVTKLSRRHIAGGLSKVNGADFTLGMVQLEEHIDDNIVQIQQIKVRNGQKRDESKDIYIDPKTLLMSDVNQASNSNNQNDNSTQPNVDNSNLNSPFSSTKNGKEKLQEALGKK